MYTVEIPFTIFDFWSPYYPQPHPLEDIISSGRDLKEIIDAIHNPMNIDFFQSTIHKQPLSWIIFNMNAPERDILKACKAILKVCPFAPEIPNRYGELPIHFCSKMKYASIIELLLKQYPECSACKTIGVEDDNLNSHSNQPIQEQIFDLLPIHILIGADELEYLGDEPESIIKHMHLLTYAFPGGLLEQTSLGQTALHIAAALGQPETFLTLLKLCPEAASIRDIDGDLPIDLILHPFDVPCDRFGKHLTEIMSQLLQIETENSINSITNWLNDNYIIGLRPDNDIRFGLGFGKPLSIEEMLAIEDMMYTFIHSIYEHKTNGKIMTCKERDPNCHKTLLHRALAVEVTENAFFNYIDMQQEFHKKVMNLDHFQGTRNKSMLFNQHKAINYQFVLQMNEKDKFGNLPLHIAATSSTLKPRILQYIVWKHPQAIIQPDAHGRLPLHLAAEHNCCIESVESLYLAYPPALLLPSKSHDEYEGFLPFHFAAACDANLDSIFSLIRKCPHVISWHNQKEWERNVRIKNRKRKAKKELFRYY